MLDVFFHIPRCYINLVFRKRSTDMRMMAEHKYRVQIKKMESWENYFGNLGKSCVKIELLSNKAQKPIKITLNDLQTANKGFKSCFFLLCCIDFSLLQELHLSSTIVLGFQFYLRSLKEGCNKICILNFPRSMKLIFHVLLSQ